MVDQPKGPGSNGSALDILVQQGQQLKPSLSTNSNRRGTQTEFSPRGENNNNPFPIVSDESKQSRTESKTDLLSTISRESSGNSVTEEVTRRFNERINTLENELKRVKESYEERIKLLLSQPSQHLTVINDLATQLESAKDINKKLVLRLQEEQSANHMLLMKVKEVESKLYAIPPRDVQTNSELPAGTTGLMTSGSRIIGLGSGSKGNLKTLVPATTPTRKDTATLSSISSPPPGVLTGAIKFQELELTTQLALNSPISEVVKKLEKRLPPEVSGYQLHLKVGKNFVLLEDDKSFGSYTSNMKIEGNKVHLEFLKKDEKEKTSKKPHPRDKENSAKNLTLTPVKTAKQHNFFDLIQNNNLESLISLFNAPDAKYPELIEWNEEGMAPLHFATRNSNARAVDIILKYYEKANVDINHPDKYGWTVMHHATSNEHGTDTDDEILRALLNHPLIRVDIKNPDNNTPLHYFCQRFKSPSCQELGILLIHRAPNSVNTINKNGETPLHKAIFNNAVRRLMVRLLIENGADVNLPNSSGNTALHYAVRLGRRDLVKDLLNAGADLFVKESRENKTPYELAVKEQKEIAVILHEAVELHKWLNSMGLEEFFRGFVRQDFASLRVLAKLERKKAEELISGIPVEKQKIFKEQIEKLRDELSKQNFEEQLQKAQKTAIRLADAKQDQVDALKISLAGIMNGNIGENSWLIKHSDIEFTKELGVGASGKVFKGLFHGAGFENGVKVAIKVFKAVDSKTLSEFRKEFHVMSVLRSPHIVHFFGACLEPKICMVMEYCARGSLHDVLKNPALTNEISWEKCFKFAIGMAQGMAILHNSDPPIFHRDMKSLNLLITKDWKILVADFGLARFNTGENMNTMKKMCGTYAYLSPELFYAQPFTDKSDLFSMGIIMWELANRILKGKYEAPYAEYKLPLDFQIPYQVAEKGLRPTIPSSCPPSWDSLTRLLWDKESDIRPSASKMAEILESMYNNEYLKDPTAWESKIAVKNP